MKQIYFLFVVLLVVMAACGGKKETSVDAEQIADVYLASRKEFLPFAPLAHSDESVRGWIAGTLIPGGGVTVAEVESSVVGMMAREVAEGKVVVPAFRVRDECDTQGRRPS